MRVLMVTPRYRPFVGGVEQHVYEVARRLAHAGVLVTVLTTDPRGDLPRREESGGVAVERVRTLLRNGDYYFAPAICRTIMSRRDEWDIVHVQSYHTFVAPFAMLGALCAGLPYVLTFHGGGHSSRLRQRLRGVQRRALRPFVRRAERLIALARFEIELYGRAYGVPRDRFELIPNGLDLPVGGPLPRPVDGLIASVGRLERYKGHHRILAALPEILRQRPEARLWIAGTGPYEEDLRRQARELSVADRVEFRPIPPQQRQRMAEELARAALVVLLSEYETHPLAILEAVSLGRPALVAATSGLAELAERGLAVAIALESSPREVARAVVRELADPHVPETVRLSTWEECALTLTQLYGRVLARDEPSAASDAAA